MQHFFKFYFLNNYLKSIQLFPLEGKKPLNYTNIIKKIVLKFISPVYIVVKPFDSIELINIT